MIKVKEKGLLIVVSGPSGCGKSTLNQLLLQKRDNVVMSISDTTRAIRGKEINGIDYNFISTEEFEENIKNNKYLEYAKVHADKYYGTPVEWVENMLDSGNDVILEIDIEGARQINEKRSDAIFIFILPPSMKILKQRLVARGTESKEQVVERFKTAYKEINEVAKYNYVIVNNDIIEDVELGNQEEIIHEILMDM